MILLLDAPRFIVRPPKFIALDSNDKQSQNPSAIRCIVDSFPRARISWYRFGEKLAEGSTFNLTNITTREQQGFYSYRVETDGFETITDDFMIYFKGRVLYTGLK